MESYQWPNVDRFIDRSTHLGRLEAWFEDRSDRVPIALAGRRRVGKSWLFRRFAHGKAAVILVADERSERLLLDSFASELGRVIEVTPAIADIADLFRVLYRIARQEQILVVIDEFPALLPSLDADRTAVLSAVAAAIEQERDDSQLKLILTGSTVSHVEQLFSERNPMHGRLTRLDLHPMSFAEGREFFARDETPASSFARYAVAGGMPMYLDRLSRGDVESALVDSVFRPEAPLWDEPRHALGRELRTPGTYFSIASQLAAGAHGLNEIATKIGIEATSLPKYLRVMEDLRLVERLLPVGAGPTSRLGHWVLADDFFRFWFRFLYPFQAELEGGRDPGDFVRAAVLPYLSDHAAPVFEEECRRWARGRFGESTTEVGAWWGRSLDRHRRSGLRSSEEIDLVGLRGREVTLVGEAKWTNKAMGADVLIDLFDYKVPALTQAGFGISKQLASTLISRSGFTKALRKLADERGVQLIDAEDVLGASPN